MVLAAPGSLKHYPAPLRKVRDFDADQQRFLVFLTNNFDLPAPVIRQPLQVPLASGSSGTCESRLYGTTRTR